MKFNKNSFLPFYSSNNTPFVINEIPYKTWSSSNLVPYSGRHVGPIVSKDNMFQGFEELVVSYKTLWCWLRVCVWNKTYQNPIDIFSRVRTRWLTQFRRCVVRSPDPRGLFPTGLPWSLGYSPPDLLVRLDHRTDLQSPRHLVPSSLELEWTIMREGGLVVTQYCHLPILQSM